MATGLEQLSDEDNLYKKLANLNGTVNRMTRTDICKHLQKANLERSGAIEVLRKRLKTHYKRELVGTPVHDTFDYFCVIDFEATCEAGDQNYLHEIIEFPALLVDAVNWTIVSEFHHYCRPVINPQLTEFCTLLTGITQDQVLKAKSFGEVLSEFDKWLQQHLLWGNNKKYSFALVTDGPWDVCRFLAHQCTQIGAPFPSYALQWINLRKSFLNFYQPKQRGGVNLDRMLDSLGMTFQGRQHCGMDDARNISRILISLLKDGAILINNEKLSSRNQQKQCSIKARKTGSKKENVEDEFDLNERLGVDPDTIGFVQR